MLGLSRAYRSLILSVLVVAGGSVACAGPVDSTPRSTRIRIADIPLVTQVPFYVALDSAYFRDEGIDVELVAVRATSDAVTLVATNQVDVGGFGPDPAVFNAMQRGVGIKMLASAAVFSAGTRASGLVVRQALIDTGDYRRLADLKGRKIEVPRPSPSSMSSARSHATGSPPPTSNSRRWRMPTWCLR